MIEILTLVVLAVASGIMAWLSARAWRAKSIVLKWSGAGVAALLSAAILFACALIITGLFKLHARSAPIPDFDVARTAERVQRGKAVADGFCSGCHSTAGTLSGGLNLGEHIPLPIGSFIAANLTPAGQLGSWSDGDIFRAVRNSIDKDGHWLMMMSFTNAGRLSDEDIASVIAYIRSLPAAGTQTGNPPDRLNALGLMMLGAGLLPKATPVSTSVITAPPKEPTASFGKYILSYQDCRGCHGERLTGGVPGQLAPLGPDLTVVKGWKRNEFIATMRTGIDPNGHELSEEMPWKSLGRMDDDELTAIYEYLKQLPNA